MEERSRLLVGHTRVYAIMDARDKAGGFAMVVGHFEEGVAVVG